MNELARRIAVTVGALLIFRLGCFIPLAGLSSETGALPSARLSVLSLTIVPYLSAAIIIQVVSVVWGRISALERSGEAGRRKIAIATLLLTLLLAAFQAFGIAFALQNIHGLVPEPGTWFVLSTVATMVGGAFFVVWLSEQITRHGVGNGLALILSLGILISLPPEVASAIELMRQGAVSSNLVLFDAIVWIALIVLIVVVELARRNVPVQFGAREAGARKLPPRSAVLPIKLNSAGFLIPTTVALWLFYLPFALASYLLGKTPALTELYARVQFGQPLHVILGAIAVFVLAFVYTARVLDPEQAAEVLVQQGGVVEGVMPGEPTADHLDRIASLTTFVGAAYLVVVSLIPEALVLGGVALPYKIGGGSVLIVICTMLDLTKQVRDLSLTNRGGERI